MNLGRALITLGLAIVVLGVLVSMAGKLPLRLGRLPGDIAIEGKNGSFYFPLMTCLLLSGLLSAIAWIVGRLR
jgi:hypothetical protein